MYDIVHDMTLRGQNVLNAYQVERANAGEGAGSISDAFQNSILPIVRLWQNDNVVNNEIRIRNLGDPLDFGTFTLAAAAGLRVGATSPSFVSGGIKFNRLRSDMKSGFKRFAGAEEGDYVEGVLSAAALVLLTNMGNAIIGNWLSSIDSHIVCNYVIIKRICTTTPPPGDPCPSYRLPTPTDTLTFYTPSSFVNSTNIRSQVSRRVSPT